MTKVYEIDGITPVIDPGSFVHPDAVLIGDCIVGVNCYIGPCACLRGDFGRIILAEGSNIQDSCVIHASPEIDVILEENANVGHGAMLHSCTIKSNALVGIGSVVMDGAVIGTNSVVAAMSFVKSNFKVPDDVLVAGIPARVVRKLSAEEIRWNSEGIHLYRELSVRSIKTMQKTVPLTKVETNKRRIITPGLTKK